MRTPTKPRKPRRRAVKVRELSDAELEFWAHVYCRRGAKVFANTIEPDFVVRDDDPEEIDVHVMPYSKKVTLFLAIADYGPRSH